MRVTHRHVAAGTNDPTKQVSVTRWNEGHRVLVAPAGTPPEEPDHVLIRYSTPTSLEVIFRDSGGTDRIVPFGGGGGGVTDGDKGDITIVAGVWTIDNNAVTDAKIASVSWGKLTGIPASFPPSAHGHTAGEITGLATVATSGSASDLAAGTLPAARFSDTAHGSRAGGTLHANATTTVAGFMSGADKTKLDGVATGATANATDAALRDRATHTGTQLAATISNFAATVIATVLTGFTVAGSRTAVAATDSILAAFGKVQRYLNDLTAVAFSGNGADLTANSIPNSRLAQIATARLRGRVTAGTGDVEDLTGTQATTLLDTFTGALKGLVPASGGGTTNFLRADGTWVAPPGGGGGSPGGTNGEIQFNNSGAFGGAADVEIENGNLRLLGKAPGAAPVAGGISPFSRLFGSAQLFSVHQPGLEPFSMHPLLGDRVSAMQWKAGGNGLADAQFGMIAVGLGTSTAVNFATTNYRTERTWREWLVTAAATTNVCGFRDTGARFTVGGAAAGRGGFLLSWIWSPATGVTNASHRAFVGMHLGGVVPTDVNPSTLLNLIGMGYDSADTQIQFMHNDGAGAATKIPLGAAFPKPSADRTKSYMIQLYSPPGTTQSVSYRVVDLETNAEATGVVTTDLPSTTTGLAPHSYMSVGGVSAVIGIAVDILTLFKFS